MPCFTEESDVSRKWQVRRHQHSQPPTKKKDGMNWSDRDGFSHASFDASGIASFCDGNHVILGCRIRDVTRFPICGRTLASAGYHTHTGDPDLAFVITWCFDPPEVIGVTWLFTEIQFTKNSTTPNIYRDCLYSRTRRGCLTVFF